MEQLDGQGSQRRDGGPRGPGIRARTLATMLLVAVPALIGFSLLVRGAARDLLRSRTEAHIRTVAAGSARAVEDLVRRGSHAALGVAASPAMERALAALETGRADAPAAVAALEESLLAAHQLHLDLQAIRVVDVEGNEVIKVREGKAVRASSPPTGPLRLPAIQSLRDRAFFREALGQPRGAVTVSDLERGRVEGETAWCPSMVRFATPLFFPSGARAGVLVVNVWGKSVGEMLNQLVPPDQGTAFLVERNAADLRRSGIYLFHHDPDSEFGNQTGSLVTAWQQHPRELVDAWMTTPEGLAVHPDTGDLLAHVYVSPYGSAERGWVVVLAAREAYFARPLARLEARVLGLSALTVALMVGAALLLSRTLTRPLRALAWGVRRLGHDLSAEVPVGGGGEVAAVAEAVNRMARSLRDQQAARERSERRLRETEKLASIGELAAGLAQELNTPLSNIRALASMARRDLAGGRVDPGALSTDLADVVDQIRRCTTIIDGLLRFARRQPPALAIHDVNALVREALALVRPCAEKKSIAVAFEPGAAQAPAVVDAAQVEQVFVNLLLNAIDAARPGGRVEISTGSEDGRVAVRVRDDGRGISPDHLPRVFDPFFTTKAVGEGTGLGLSVSYGIVRSHGGAISVESTPGRGATFTVTLPAEAA